MRTILNVVAFQAGWCASVLGAAHGLPWLGPVAVMLGMALHLSKNSGWRAEVVLAIAAGVFGFLVDSALIAGGTFSPVRFRVAAPWSPLWMVFLWVNFATLVNVSLKWLQGRYLLAALLGAVGGPAAYYSGGQLGAVQDAMGISSILVLSVVWSGAVPALFFIARVIDKYLRS